jgi:hypothetical protein
MRESLFISFLFCVVSTFGQTHKTIKITKPKDKPTLRSTISKSGDLYAGIPNKMKWVDTVQPFKEYLVKIESHGWWNDKEIYADASAIGDSITIYIFKTKEKDTVEVNIERLAVDKVPDPVLCINGKQITNMVSKQDLLKSKKMSTFMSDDIIGANTWFKIESFDMHVNNSTLHSDSSALSSIMLSAIKSASGRITFTEIKVLGPDGIVRLLGNNGKDFDLQLVQ